MSNTTTIAGTPANPTTLNENELWENFLALASIDDVNGYKETVRNVVDWQYDTELIDDVLIRLADENTDATWITDPALNLEQAAVDLRCAADRIDRIMNAFADFKRQHVADADDPDCNRYRVPVVESVEEVA